MSTITLYRPVGPAELQLIEAAKWRRFPPRLPEQPIFYPVMNLEYARQIARQLTVAIRARVQYHRPTTQQVLVWRKKQTTTRS